MLSGLQNPLPKILAAAILAASATLVSPHLVFSDPTTIPAVAPITITPVSTAPATTLPATTIPPNFQPNPHPSIEVTTSPAEHAAMSAFVGSVKGDRVYVRSGPGSNFYPIGQLVKGNTVQVVATKNGWYEIAPPTGAQVYVAKELVETDAAGKTGTVTAATANIRTASKLFPSSDYARLGQIHKGDTVNILGSTDKYYLIDPPEKTYYYISATMVKPADPGTAYEAPELKLPANLPTVAITTEPAGTQASTESSTQPGETVAVHPTAYSQDAYTQFTALNKQTQAEDDKPLLQRDLTGLVKKYQDLLATSNLPPSVKQGSEARIDALQKTIKLQELAAANSDESTKALQDKLSAYDQTWKQSQAKLQAYQAVSPFLAEGRLQTSSALSAKYVLVNPATGRVVAYVDPDAAVPISKLIGEYVGVKGSVESEAGTEIKVIKVTSATLTPVPQ